MGGNGRRGDRKVTSGPFAYRTGEWTLTVNDTPDTPEFLRRAFKVIRRRLRLPTSTRVNLTLSRIPYDASPWNFNTDPANSFREDAEVNLHNLVHRSVGGTMMQACSPNDPVFFLHHCNVDRLWARWQKRNPTQSYLPSSGGPIGHNIDDPMWPWASESDPPTPRKVLDHQALGYTYDDQAGW
jgi:tyrosinase